MKMLQNFTNSNVKVDIWMQNVSSILKTFLNQFEMNPDGFWWENTYLLIEMSKQRFLFHIIHGADLNSTGNFR